LQTDASADSLGSDGLGLFRLDELDLASPASPQPASPRRRRAHSLESIGSASVDETCQPFRAVIEEKFVLEKHESNGEELVRHQSVDSSFHQEMDAWASSPLALNQEAGHFIERNEVLVSNKGEGEGDITRHEEREIAKQDLTKESSLHLEPVESEEPVIMKEQSMSNFECPSCENVQQDAGLHENASNQIHFQKEEVEEHMDALESQVVEGPQPIPMKQDATPSNLEIPSKSCCRIS